MYETFIDLDELIGRCRDKQAKKLIQEAIACYRAGAFRSCIVATWNAVVFNFLHKLRELELLGDGKATEILKDFENKSLNSDFKGLWGFESDISKKALEDFELISPVEQKDIIRLFEDRSRCAHPSMASLEEPFEATAELARYHLRSAVIHLLQRETVQGRSALKRIWKSLKSENFPSDVESAIIVLQKSPLARARQNVIKDIVIGLTKSLLIDSLPEDERQRQFAALNAVSKMYPKEVGEILNDKLSYLIEDKIDDAKVDKVIIYLGSVTAWESISEPCQIKAKVFIDKLDIYETAKYAFEHTLFFEHINILVKAAYVDFLRDSVISKLQIPLNKLIEIKKHYKDTLLNEKVINPLLKSAIHEATLDDLTALISDADTTLYDIVEPRIKNEIKKASLEELLLLILEYNNEYLHKLIKPCMKDQISKASLKDLLLAMLNYKSELMKLDKQLIELTDTYIIEKIQQIPFDSLNQLIEIKSTYQHPIIDKHFKELLKNNVSSVVDRFIKSSAYASAAGNASLLIEIIEYLSPKQWEYILEAFCSNDQIYDSYSCPASFISLFKKSVEITGTVEPYWLSFREKLDGFNGKYKEINRLKQLIDSSQKTV